MLADFHDSLIALGISCGSIAALLAVRFLAFHLLKRAKGGSEGRAIVVRVVRVPSFFWSVIAGLRIGTEFWHADDHFLKLINLTISVLAAISLTMVASRALKEMVSHYLNRIGSALAHNGLIMGMIAGTSFLIGSMILLSQLGVRIEPLLTAFGVGGLAIGLALQDTLSNVFAGLGMLIDRSIDIGDAIKLENGMEGTVLDIGWRTTRLRMDSRDLMVVPNIKLAQTIAIRKIATAEKAGERRPQI